MAQTAMPLGIAAVAGGITLAYAGYKGMKVQDVVRHHLLGGAAPQAVFNTAAFAAAGGGTGVGAAAGGLAGGAVGNASAVIAEARKHLGTPYVWGGATPGGFDCSGLVQWCFKAAGVSVPRVAAAQQLAGKGVSLSALQPGDVVFYGTPAWHCGLYIGGGQMIVAPKTGDVVKVQGVNGPGRPTNARRYL